MLFNQAKPITDKMIFGKTILHTASAILSGNTSIQTSICKKLNKLDFIQIRLTRLLEVK